jgi:hypothetical protein
MTVSALVTKMKITDFKHQYNEAAAAFLAGGLDSFSLFLKHKIDGAKQFREELTAIYGFVVTTETPDTEDIVIGGEKENFDAQVGGSILEVVRALPESEHVLRKQVAEGTVPQSTFQSTIQHSPQRLAELISGALIKKQKKHYSDKRILLISVDGEETQEDDQAVNDALSIVRTNATHEPFVSVWIVETARRKAFLLLPSDA